ncbi:MAG: phage holin family protein [Mycobacteriales bacterium]
MTRTLSEDATIGELVARITAETSTLVRDELRLAQLEMARKGRYAGIGAGLLGGGALFAVLGLGALVAAAVLGLAVVLPAWAAAVIVAGALFVLAGVAALVGKKEITAAVPPLPEEALRGVKLDLAALKR